MTLAEQIAKWPEEYKPVYTGELLYIIRNHGNDFDKNNRSILGVFTTPQHAQKAILSIKERQKKDRCTCKSRSKGSNTKHFCIPRLFSIPY